MKKVLILVNHDVVIYNFRLELVERLLEENYYVYISSPYGERIDDLKELGCKFIETPISRHGTSIKEDFNLILKYREMMKWIRPDIVLTFTIKPNIYGGMAASSLDIPFIANITGLGTAVENGGIMQKVTTQLYRIAFQKVKCVFFQNEENKQFFIDRNIAMGKHQLIPGSGVNLERFPLLEYPKEDDIIRFVFISRIMKEKGIDQYLEAAEYIKDKYPYTEFHICGFYEENYEDILKDYMRRNIVIYHGMVKNITEILKYTHCTILPSYHEGMSNVLLESAACGRPIITTDISGCREVVDIGENGFLVKLKNTKSLIDGIETFLNLTYDQILNLGLKSRKKVEKKFNRDIVVQTYINKINGG